MGYDNIPSNIKQYLPGEFQTDSSPIPENTNFLTNNKFVFILNRTPNISYFCQRVNIPSVSFGISLQNSPTPVQIQRPGTSINYEELQLGFAVSEKMENWFEIYKWMKDMTPFNSSIETYKENQKVSDGTILVLNSSYRPIISMKFYDLFPSFLSGIDFDCTLPDTSNVIASVSFTFSYFDYEIL